MTRIKEQSTTIDKSPENERTLKFAKENQYEQCYGRYVLEINSRIFASKEKRGEGVNPSS